MLGRYVSGCRKVRGPETNNWAPKLRVSQGELAKRLGVHESQVSRDERNEYFGITLECAIKILDTLNVRLRTKVEVESEREMVAV